MIKKYFDPVIMRYDYNPDALTANSILNEPHTEIEVFLYEGYDPKECKIEFRMGTYITESVNQKEVFSYLFSLSMAIIPEDKETDHKDCCGFVLDACIDNEDYFTAHLPEGIDPDLFEAYPIEENIADEIVDMIEESGYYDKD